MTNMFKSFNRELCLPRARLKYYTPFRLSSDKEYNHGEGTLTSWLHPCSPRPISFLGRIREDNMLTVVARGVNACGRARGEITLSNYKHCSKCENNDGL
jgi:hypothetical protein